MYLHLIPAVLALMILMQSPTMKCGPARSFALVAQRSPKIPISIRAPFKHTETMVARGYGKRAYSTNPSIKSLVNDLSVTGRSELEKDGLRQYLLPRGWGKRMNLAHPNLADYQSYGKKEMEFLDEGTANNEGVNETAEQISNENGQIDGVPLDWVVNELTTNPGLLKVILYRFVDTNKDGLLTSQEFLGTSTSDSNNNSY